MGNHGPAKVLTPRDRALLHFTGQAGLATISQIHRRHWPDCTEQAARDRLRQLQRAGYVQFKYTRVRGTAERVCVLTRQGRDVFSPAERECLRVGLPPAAEQQQQILAQEVHVRLEQELTRQGGTLLNWADEHQLKGEVSRARHAARTTGTAPAVSECADARATVEIAGQQQDITIEIDGKYFGKMLANKMHSLGSGAGRIIYVCTPERVRTIQAAVANYPNIEIMTV